MLSLGGKAQVPPWEWGVLHCLLHLLEHNWLSCQSSWVGYASQEGLSIFSMWMCAHHNISPMGSFHTWIHCLRKDFGIIKNIIPPHRICFLLLLQMADCFESFQCFTAREEVAITNSKNSWRLPKWVLEDGISCYLLKDFWNYIHTLLCFSGHRIPNAAFC